MKEKLQMKEKMTSLPVILVYSYLWKAEVENKNPIVNNFKCSKKNYYLNTRITRIY